MNISTWSRLAVHGVSTELKKSHHFHMLKFCGLRFSVIIGYEGNLARKISTLSLMTDPKDSMLSASLLSSLLNVTMRVEISLNGLISVSKSISFLTISRSIVPRSGCPGKWTMTFRSSGWSQELWPSRRWTVQEFLITHPFWLSFMSVVAEVYPAWLEDRSGCAEHVVNELRQFLSGPLHWLCIGFALALPLHF